MSDFKTPDVKEMVADYARQADDMLKELGFVSEVRKALSLRIAELMVMATVTTADIMMEMFEKVCDGQDTDGSSYLDNPGAGPRLH